MSARTACYALVCSMLIPVACLAAKDDAKADAKSDAKAEATVDLKLISSGATRKLGGYNPQQLKLSEKQPASVKKAPKLSAPLYGEIRFAGKTYAIALDEPKDGKARLYVDANGNGDLTDDPETTWTSDTYPGQGGAQLTKYGGSFKLPLKAGDQEEQVTLQAYRFDKNDPGRKQLKDTLLYYSDYALEGDITLAGEKYHALVIDLDATGAFAPAKGADAARNAGSNRLLIDLNGDGKFAPRGEMFEPGKPFNIKGTTWALAPAEASGGGPPVRIAKSDEKVEEVALPPNHAVGQKITPFTAKRMDGKTVNFPADYKGKVVLLDFWATWCPPCMAEVDGMVSTYKEYHPKGVEILGISLDQPDSANKVKSVTAEKGMTWPEVYDGKMWEAAVAVKYGIDSIPAGFLVDGDTGEILAVGESLRGDGLGAEMKKALEQKKGSGAQAAKADVKKGDAKPEPAKAGETEKPAAQEKPAKDEKPS